MKFSVNAVCLVDKFRFFSSVLSDMSTNEVNRFRISDLKVMGSDSIVFIDLRTKDSKRIRFLHESYKAKDLEC